MSKKEFSKDDLLVKYLLLANEGFSSIQRLIKQWDDPAKQNVDILREIYYLSEALFRLPTAPDAKLNIEKELTENCLTYLVSKYPKYQYMLNEFNEVTQMYESNPKLKK